MVVLEIQPEDVVMIEVKNNLDQNHAIEIPVRIGHTIGNLHPPIKLERNKIYFPIEADTELEMFKKLFAPINDHLDIAKDHDGLRTRGGSEYMSTDAPSLEQIGALQLLIPFFQPVCTLHLVV